MDYEAGGVARGRGRGRGRSFGFHWWDGMEKGEGGVRSGGVKGMILILILILILIDG